MFHSLETTFPQLARAYGEHERASGALGAAELWESAWQAAAYADAIDSELIVDGAAAPRILLWGAEEAG